MINPYQPMKKLFTLIVMLLCLAGLASAQHPINPAVEIIEDFETGDFSMFPWNLSSRCPWEITSENPYQGSFCIRSGNPNFPSSSSSIEVIVEIPENGIMGFFYRISSEYLSDNGYFYIDNERYGFFSGQETEWREFTCPITAGTHTFRWDYVKDNGNDTGEDRFYVDDIAFFRYADPVETGWHTYSQGTFLSAEGNSTGVTRWAYEYPVEMLENYVGLQMTKVSLFSDDVEQLVGGNYTCTIYRGGEWPMAGDTVLSFSVDVPQGRGDWVEWNLPEPVRVKGTKPLWVMWTANTTVSNSPAGYTGNRNDLGMWWFLGQDGVNNWGHQGNGVWAMRQYFEVTPPVYTISTAVTPRGSGEVTGDGEYFENDNCVLTAIPNPGYTFLGWTEDEVTLSDQEVYEFVVTGDRHFVAHFSGTGIDENGESALNVYPSPAHDRIHIEGLDDHGPVLFYDSLGKLVLTANASQDIDISSLTSGVYMIRSGGKTVRFVKE